MSVEVLEIEAGSEAVKVVARTLWRIEEGAPGWYRAESRLWTAGEEALVHLLNTGCRVWGIWVGGIGGVVGPPELVCVIFGEYYRSDGVNIHIGLAIDRDRINEEGLGWVRVGMRELLVREVGAGLCEMVGWVERRNRGVRRIAEGLGMDRTGLVMVFGSYRGKVMEWVEHKWRCKKMLDNVI